MANKLWTYSKVSFGIVFLYTRFGVYLALKMHIVIILDIDTV